jgi:hypothetical protein
MKSEERHKLQQNELADYLAKAMEKSKPYQNYILGGIIFVLVLILFVHWMNGRAAEAERTANDEIARAFNSPSIAGEPSELVDVAKKYPGNPAAINAALAAADIYLNNACNQLFVNKLKAKEDLGHAVTLYQEFLPEVSDPFLKAKVIYGLARAEECQNELSKAKTHYQEIVSKWPDGPYGVLASRRLTDIDRPATKELYDKFANYDPKPFKDTPGAVSPTDPMGVPTEPLFKTDTLSEKMNASGEKKSEIKPGDLLKDKLPPTGDQPAGEKKAEESKPADANQPTPEPIKPAEEGKQPDTPKPANDPAPATPPPAETPAPTTPPAADAK